MKSEKNAFDNDVLELIEKIFEEHDDGLLELVCVENNGEVTIGFIEAESTFDVGYTLSLPVHLVEFTGYDERDELYSSYKFYPYRQIADKFSDLIFNQKPSVVFVPSEDIIEAYMTYWLKITYNMSCTEETDFGIMSSTKS